MEARALIGAPVELTAPDGRVFRFRVVSLAPYAGETYAVLEHEGADGQLLVTHIEMDEEGAPIFVVVGEEDIISAVLEKQVAQTIAQAMERMPEQDEDGGGEEHACRCGDEHCHAGSDCGHDCRGYDHHSSHRSLPSYIKRAGQ